jgi:transcriptional regulator GlxA family with amidase domain
MSGAFSWCGAKGAPMSSQANQNGSVPLRVCLLALPDAIISTLAGIYDVMNGVSMMGIARPRTQNPFKVEIVGEEAGLLRLASGVPIEVQRSIEDISACDILIVPSVLLKPGGWQTGRYPRLVDWIVRMHDGGAKLCSACSGPDVLRQLRFFEC